MEDGIQVVPAVLLELWALSPEDDEVLPTSSSSRHFLVLIINDSVLMHVNSVGFLPSQSSPCNVCCWTQYVFGPSLTLKSINFTELLPLSFIQLEDHLSVLCN